MESRHLYEPQQTEFYLFDSNTFCNFRYTKGYSVVEYYHLCQYEYGEFWVMQARRQLNWIGGGGMDSQCKLLSGLLSDQAAFITSPKTSLANYWVALPPAPQCLRAWGYDYSNKCKFS